MLKVTADSYEHAKDCPFRNVLYELTPLGRSILKPIKQFLKWTLDAFPEIKRAREAFDGAPAASRTPEPR